MEKLLKSSLSLLLLVGIACEKPMSPEAKKALAEKKWRLIIDNNDHEIYMSQGSAQTMNLIEEIIELDPSHCDALRERSVPYLKRGMPIQWKKYFDEAVACDAIRWQGWRGYLYLYFYRDYKKAIADFDATDHLTPNHIDAPQGHSVDFWRGHAYLGLKDYEQSLYYYQKHIDHVTKEFGEDWVEPEAFLNMAIAQYENKNYEAMRALLDKALYYYQDKTADTKYYYARYMQAVGETKAALEWIDHAIDDFLEGQYKKRPYNEEIKQVYLEELLALEKALKNPAD